MPKIKTKKIKLTFGKRVFNFAFGWLPFVKKYPTEIEDFQSTKTEVENKIVGLRSYLEKLKQVEATRAGVSENQDIISKLITNDNLLQKINFYKSNAQNTATQDQQEANNRVESNVTKPMPVITPEVNKTNEKVTVDTKPITPEAPVAPDAPPLIPVVSEVLIAPDAPPAPDFPEKPTATPAAPQAPDAPEAPAVLGVPMADANQQTPKTPGAQKTHGVSNVSSAQKAPDGLLSAIREGIKLKKMDRVNEANVQKELSPHDKLLAEMGERKPLKKVQRVIKPEASGPLGKLHQQVQSKLRSMEMNEDEESENREKRSASVKEFDPVDNNQVVVVLSEQPSTKQNIVAQPVVPLYDLVNPNASFTPEQQKLVEDRMQMIRSQVNPEKDKLDSEPNPANAQKEGSPKQGVIKRNAPRINSNQPKK